MNRIPLSNGSCISVGLYNCANALKPVSADNCLKLVLVDGKWVVSNPEVLDNNLQAIHAARTSSGIELAADDIEDFNVFNDEQGVTHFVLYQVDNVGAA